MKPRDEAVSRIPSQMLSHLRELARDRKCDIGQVINEALDLYLALKGQHGLGDKDVEREEVVGGIVSDSLALYAALAHAGLQISRAPRYGERRAPGKGLGDLSHYRNRRNETEFAFGGEIEIQSPDSTQDSVNTDELLSAVESVSAVEAAESVIGERAVSGPAPSATVYPTAEVRHGDEVFEPLVPETSSAVATDYPEAPVQHSHQVFDPLVPAAQVEYPAVPVERRDEAFEPLVATVAAEAVKEYPSAPARHADNVFEALIPIDIPVRRKDAVRREEEIPLLPRQSAIVSRQSAIVVKQPARSVSKTGLNAGEGTRTGSREKPPASADSLGVDHVLSPEVVHEVVEKAPVGNAAIDKAAGAAPAAYQVDDDTPLADADAEEEVLSLSDEEDVTFEDVISQAPVSAKARVNPEPAESAKRPVQNSPATESKVQRKPAKPEQPSSPAGRPTKSVARTTAPQRGSKKSDKKKSSRITEAEIAAILDTVAEMETRRAPATSKPVTAKPVTSKGVAELPVKLPPLDSIATVDVKPVTKKPSRPLGLTPAGQSASAIQSRKTAAVTAPTAQSEEPADVEEGDDEALVDDAQIKQRVLKQLANSGIAAFAGLNVDVINGVAMVQGTLASAYERSLMDQTVRRVAGVKKVIQRIIQSGPAPKKNKLASLIKDFDWRGYKYAGIACGLLLTAGLAWMGTSALANARPRTHAVKGRIFLGETPMTEAALRLYPAKPTMPQDVFPKAVTNADGTFELSTFGGKDGAPEGEYIVTAAWFPVYEQDGEMVRGPNFVPAEYTDAKKSTLRLVVEKGKAELAPITIPK